MARFVVDASATMPWCFQDEATTWSDELLMAVRGGSSIVVPAHWPVEVINVLRVGERKGRITAKDSDDFWNDLSELRIEVQPALFGKAASDLLGICRKHQLTAYDAAYLELATRLNLPFATLDDDLISACRAEGVTLL